MILYYIVHAMNCHRLCQLSCSWESLHCNTYLIVATCLLWYTLHRVTFSLKLIISEKKQRIDETVSQKQEGLKRRPGRLIPDTDPVPFHNSNEKERVITREDEGPVLSHDERPKEKYKFRGEVNSENIFF